MRTLAEHAAELVESQMDELRLAQFAAYCACLAQDGGSSADATWDDAHAWGAGQLTELQAKALFAKAIRHSLRVAAVDRDPAIAHPDGMFLLDSSGVYVGDGATAGGLILDAHGTDNPPTIDGYVVGARYKVVDGDGSVLSELHWNGTAWE